MGIVHKNSETNKKECLLSVIIRTHNSENVIEKAIESVLEQTISKDIYELIIIDDDSADNTENKIKSHDNKIKFIKGKKLGPIKAINIGIKESRGKYYVLLDSDDTFELNALEELLNTIKQNNCDCVYSDYHEIDVEKNEIKTISLKNNILNGIAAGVIFKKKSVNEVNNYDEELFFPEYDLFIKLIKNNCKFIHISKPLYNYFRHNGSLTANKKSVRKGYKQLYDKYGNINGLKYY